MTDSRASLALDQIEALDAARDLVAAGVPLFVAEPCSLGCWAHPTGTGSGNSGFDFPGGWEGSTPDLGAVEKWRPGDALGAVMGHGLDLVDIDPRNGGDATLAGMMAAGVLPYVYAEASTPSGGRHKFVASMGVRSHDAVRPGIDVKAGNATGGRGFAFIAPTVKISKTTGLPTPYVWTQRLDVEGYVIEARYDATGLALAEAVDAVRSRSGARPAPRQRTASDDPFGDPAPGIIGWQMAVDNCMRAIREFAELDPERDSAFNARLNNAAMTLGHYEGAGVITYEQARDALLAAAGRNGSLHKVGSAHYTPMGRQGVLRTIDSGWSAGAANPNRVRPREASSAPAARETTGDDSEGAPAGDPVEMLLAEMLTSEQLQLQPNPEPLINGVLDIDTTAWLIGRSGTFKSFVALDWTGHVATGRPWQGRAVRRGLVVYIVAEGARGAKLRARAWEKTYGPMGANVRFLPRPVQAARHDQWQVLVDAVAGLQPVLIVIDTQSRVTVGLNENDNSEMMSYVAAADRLRRACGACVLTVHHQGRTGLDARGASSIDGAQDAEIRIERPQDSRHVILHMDKQKDADDSAVIELDLIAVDGGEDPTTGRDLSSLAVSPTPIRREVSKPHFEDLPENQSKIIGIVWEHFPVGGTKSEIKALLKTMPNGSWQTAFGALVKKEILLKVRGTSRWILETMITGERGPK